MDEKGLKNIAHALMQVYELKEVDAERLVKAFFETISEGLEEDQYVRVAGLGTFRQLVADNVSGQILFTPENRVQELVNKPFAHFEAVVLNESVDLEHLNAVGDLLASEEKLAEKDEPVGEEVKIPDHAEEKPKKTVSVEITEHASIVAESQELEEQAKTVRDSSMRIERQKSPLTDGKERDGRLFFVLIVLIGLLAIIAALVFLLWPEWLEQQLFGST